MTTRALHVLTDGVPPDPPPETEAVARYREHLDDCQECDAGKSRHCHLGRVLHNRWARVAMEQRG